MLYDLIVIGGGPAGYLAAEKAGAAGFSVLLAEKKALGGVCLNEGCIPTKTMLYSAKLYDGAVHGEKYGVTVENAFLDHEAVANRKNKVVRMLTAGIKAKLRGANVTVAEGTAVILGKSSGIAGVDAGADAGADADGTAGNALCRGAVARNDFSGCFDVSIGENVYTGRRILVATGSVPVIPPIPGIREGMENGTLLTNSGILALREVPGELVIIGGGIIGLEMASYFNSAGSKVTVIEMLDHIAGPTDREIAGILMKNCIKKGVEFKLGARVTEMRHEGTKATVVFETGGQTFEVSADKVLLSVGRKPSIDGLGLETIGVATERGRIITDGSGRTNVPGVYAAGDVNGVSMLAHTAYREAEVCVNNMLGREDHMRYDAIPSVIYTNPEVAGVGETEETAAEKGLKYEAAKLPMNYSGRYAAENDGGDGICKVLVEKGSGKIIGVHMIGGYASEIIYGAGLMIGKEMTAADVTKLVFPHPTVSEIIREVSAGFKEESRPGV